MILWRIYTELKNRAEIIRYAKRVFPNEGVTFYNGQGVWHGVIEQSLIIEFIGILNDELRVNNLALFIKNYNEQQAILVTAQELSNSKLL